MGPKQQQSYGSLTNSNSRFNSSDRKNKNHHSSNKKNGGLVELNGVVSSASLMWTPEDDMGNKMVAKLAPSPQSDPILDNSAVLNTT